MHQRAQRLLLLGQALIVVLGAFFTAVGVNALLASTLVSLTPRSLAEIKPPPKVNEATKPLPTNELLFARDLFNQFAGESAVATDPIAATDTALEAVTETSTPTA
ncbi:MAG: hypothetical protein RBU37_18955, partial [Myxococcota bacterium]|nr:hypothetical protein [Myxococcota bacterium]